ncbi:MAG: ROK family protein [Gemmatimonadota bacterium]|nr:ROK family protein [Gemmatimonadota bacterium]
MPASKGQRYIVGVDVGGTNIVVGVMPSDGSRTLAVRDHPTQAEGGAEGVVDRIVSMIEQVMRDVSASEGAAPADFVGVGMGAPGPLDRERGVVVVAPNLGWHDFPLRDVIADRVKLPVTLDNDANCATLGEWWRGAAQGGRNVIGVTIGTGIGGGIVLDGALYHGSSDVAGEIGHTTIEAAGRYCRCGNYGCLEAYASGPAIALRAREALERDEISVLRKLVDGHLERLTAADVYDAANRGDALALEIVRDTARFLGTGVANLLNTLNPDVVVIAGGVTRAGDRLFEPLRAEVRRRAFRPAVTACRIVPGSLPGTAGVVGAVATFKQQKMGGV